MEAIFGIDVSKWQGDFDFAKAKAEGVKYAILKAGGSDGGGRYVDSKFIRNYNEAKKNGIPVGAYFFTTALTEAEAKKDAEYIVQNCLNGRQFEYPIFFDAETEAHRKIGKDKFDAVIKAFCNTLESKGYWAGFYTNSDFFNNYFHGETLASRYSAWVASWGTKCPSNCQMWQFGGDVNRLRSKYVAGVVCDQNYCYVDYPTMIKANGLNGFAKKVVKPKESPKTNALKVGDKVTVKNPTIYGTNKTFKVYFKTYDIMELNGNRAVIGVNNVICAAIDVKNLAKA